MSGDIKILKAASIVKVNHVDTTHNSEQHTIKDHLEGLRCLT